MGEDSVHVPAPIEIVVPSEAELIAELNADVMSPEQLIVAAFIGSNTKHKTARRKPKTGAKKLELHILDEMRERRLVFNTPHCTWGGLRR